MEHLPIDVALQRVLEHGYEGFETPLPTALEAAKLGSRLPVIPMLFVEDTEQLKTGLDAAGQLNPLSVTVHAGKDWWSFDRGATFFERALEVVNQGKLTVNFETHRGRLLFDPKSTVRYLEEFPDLHIVADFSHWTCVCESLLHDQTEAVEFAICRTRHIHARIGHAEGPQVPDPRAAMWHTEVKRFVEFWDAIRTSASARLQAELTVTPEFGPPHYMWTDPKSGEPLADLFEVCTYTRDLLRDHWNR
jgi:sugar phosphate isomerase/epimerase